MKNGCETVCDWCMIQLLFHFNQKWPICRKIFQNVGPLTWHYTTSHGYWSNWLEHGHPGGQHIKKLLVKEQLKMCAGASSSFALTQTQTHSHTYTPHHIKAHTDRHTVKEKKKSSIRWAEDWCLFLFCTWTLMFHNVIQTDDSMQSPSLWSYGLAISQPHWTTIKPLPWSRLLEILLQCLPWLRGPGEM